MRRRGKTCILGIALFAGPLLMTAGMAAPTTPRADGLESPGPHCAVASGAPEWRAVWLGHFAGGRNIRTEDGPALDWQDKYYCFNSRSACQQWQRVMRSTWKGVEGYRTCVFIRNGPLEQIWPAGPPEPFPERLD